jgi:hypothetical protein
MEVATEASATATLRCIERWRELTLVAVKAFVGTKKAASNEAAS